MVDINKIPEDAIRRGGDGRGTGKTTDASEDENGAEPQDDDKDDDKKKGGRGGGKKVLLAKFLAHHGVDVDNIKAIEVIGEDAVLGRFDKSLWSEYRDTFTFGVPKRNAKRLRMELLEPVTPYPGPVVAQAFAIYSTIDPSDREIIVPRRRPRRK